AGPQIGEPERDKRREAEAQTAFILGATQGHPGSIYRSIVGWMGGEDRGEKVVMALNAARSLADRTGGKYHEWAEWRRTEGDMDGYQVAVNVLSRMGFERATVLSGEEAERRRELSAAKVYYLLSAQRGNVMSRVKVGDWWYYHGTKGGGDNKGWRGGLWKLAREMRETGIMDFLGLGSNGDDGSGAASASARASSMVDAPSSKSIALSHYRFASPSSSQASYNLGYLYQFGIGLPEPDYALAKRYYDMVKEESEFAAAVALKSLHWGERWSELVLWWRGEGGGKGGKEGEKEGGKEEGKKKKKGRGTFFDAIEGLKKVGRGGGGALTEFLEKVLPDAVKSLKSGNKSSTQMKGKKKKKGKNLRTLSSILYKHFTSGTFFMLVAVFCLSSVFAQFQKFRVLRSMDNLRRWEEARQRESEEGAS
ncbi:hypothetical protein TrRE_jg2800, partial [Triparma retinervis]